MMSKKEIEWGLRFLGIETEEKRETFLSLRKLSMKNDCHDSSSARADYNTQNEDTKKVI